MMRRWPVVLATFVVTLSLTLTPNGDFSLVEFAKPVTAAGSRPSPTPRAPVPPRSFVPTVINRTPVGGPTSAVALSPATLDTAHEVAALRTRNSRTFRYQGHLVSVVSPVPANFQDAQGRWQAIDSNLGKSGSASGTWRNRSNSLLLTLPSDLGQSPVRLESSGSWVEFKLQGGSARGSVAGDTATYANALPGVTVALKSLADGVKESLTLAGPSAGSTFTYSFRSSHGLSLRTRDDGGLDVVDGAGVARFYVPAPFMYDSSQNSAAFSPAVRLVVDKTRSSASTITLSADPVWLASSDRRWPVVIDPSFHGGSSYLAATRFCEIDNGSLSSTSNCSGTTTQLGYDGTIVHRGLLQFSLQGLFSTPVVLLGAQLSLSTPASGGPDLVPGPPGVSVEALSETWSTGATWNTRNGATAWATPGGTVGATSLATLESASTTRTTWASVGMLPLVQQWVTDAGANNGVVVESSDETTQGSATIDATSPHLYVAWDDQLGELPYYRTVGQGLNDRLQSEVNVVNGNLLLKATDFTVKGTGMDLQYIRYFNLDANAGSGSWTNNLGDVYLESEQDQTIVLHGPSGYEAAFAWNSTSYLPAPGLQADLACGGQPATCSVTFHNGGLVYNFSALPQAGSIAQLASIVDAGGDRIGLSYNTNNTLASATDTQGRVTTFAYGSSLGSNLITQATDPAGRTYEYFYTLQQFPQPVGSVVLLTGYIDAGGNQTTFTYDLTNGHVQITDPLKNATTVNFDTSTHRVTSVVRPGSVTTGYTYNSGTTAVTDPDGNQTTYSYDNLGRVTKTVDPMGKVTTTTYSSSNVPTSQTNPAGGTTNFGSDGNNNPTSRSSVGGPTTSNSFQDAQNPFSPTSRTDTQGNRWTYVYGPGGRIMQKTDPMGRTTKYTYDANGRMSSLTDPNGSTTSYQYDVHGNLTKVVNPAPMGPESFTWDGLSRLSSTTDGRGSTTSFTYDALDRQIKITYADRSAVSTTYDANGNTIARQDVTGTTTQTFDALNRMTKQTPPAGQSITYGYDRAGNLTSETDSGGTITQQFNAGGQLTAVTDRAGGKTTFQYTTTTSSWTYPNGITETVSTDQFGETTSVKAVTSTGTVLTSLTYSYVNPANGSATTQRYEVTDAAGNVTTFSYDQLNHLSGAVTKNASGGVTANRQYTYDGVGNLTSSSTNGTTTNFTYNAANEVTQAGATTYSYDAAGNETGDSTGAALTYNAAGQTTGITPAGGSQIQMTYAGSGQAQRVQAGSVTFQYDGGGLTSSNVGGTSTYYAKLPNGWMLSEQVRTGVYYYLHDALGSVLALTDKAGSIVNGYQYDPYGNVVSQQEAVPNIIKWVGGIWDAAAGLYKLGDRYYSPTLTRFTQRDPAHQCVNGYGYASDDPVDNSDPSGDLWISCWGPGWYSYWFWGWWGWWGWHGGYFGTCLFDFNQWDDFFLPWIAGGIGAFLGWRIGGWVGAVVGWIIGSILGWLAWCCTNSDTGNFLLVTTNFQIWWAPGYWWYENLGVYWEWGRNAGCNMAWWQGYAYCWPW